MISHVIHYGVPNTPELLREHLARNCHKVSRNRAKRLAALYNLMLKEPVQWTDPTNEGEVPFAYKLKEYEKLGRGTAWSDVRLLCESGLVFGFKRPPTPLEMIQSLGIV